MAETYEPADIGDRARRELQLAREGEDDARLAVLEDLLERLEAELERDVGKAGAPRR